MAASILSTCMVQARYNSYVGSIKVFFMEHKFNQESDFNQENYFTEDKAKYPILIYTEVSLSIMPNFEVPMTSSSHTNWMV